MADFGEIIFRASSDTSKVIKQLGSGTYDHLGLFGPNGTTSAVEVNSYQDTSWIVDNAGAPSGGTTTAGVGAPAEIRNNKYISSTQVEVSGFLADTIINIVDLNVFDVANLATEPNFLNDSSGTLNISYVASGASTVNTFNAKVFAYDSAGALTAAPPDVNVFSYEINASGQFIDAVDTSGVWKNIDGQAAAMQFVNHSAANGWQPANKHVFVCGITAQAGGVGTLDQWNLAFSIQFA